MRSLQSWVARARKFKLEAQALYLACRDTRTPWYAKAVAALVVAYAFSPIDLIPDPIPVIGHLDDVLLVPLGVWIAARLIPAEVLAECRAQVAGQQAEKPRTRWWVVAGIIAAWVALGGMAVYWLAQYWRE
jgi:uncharacterized membrane protein YkvA (DUF1232 family)